MEWPSSYMVLLFVIPCGLSGRTEFSKQSGKVHTFPQMEEMVINRGYPLETHTVTTQDGYILTVFRIPNTSKSKKYPVFFQHGILACSANYLGNRKGLPYYLADKGYDVWVGNARGTIYSIKHTKWDAKKDKKYWKFSFHEMGVFDLPAVIDHIRREAKVDKIHYVGMSMGTTMFLVMATETDYLDYVDAVVLMAPVARPVNMGAIATNIKKSMTSALLRFLTYVGVDSIKHIKGIGKTIHNMCASGWLVPICKKMLTDGTDLFDWENALDAFWFVPGGVSIRSFKHFIQIAKAGKFQQYDYRSRKKNFEKYNSYEPPEYELRKIDKTIYLLVGGADTTAAKEDVEWLAKRLQRSVFISESFEDFDHRHFDFGTKIPQIHKTVEEIIEASENGRRPNIRQDILLRTEPFEDVFKDKAVKSEQKIMEA